MSAFLVDIDEGEDGLLSDDEAPFPLDRFVPGLFLFFAVLADPFFMVVVVF